MVIITITELNDADNTSWIYEYESNEYKCFRSNTFPITYYLINNSNGNYINNYSPTSTNNSNLAYALSYFHNFSNIAIIYNNRIISSANINNLSNINTSESKESKDQEQKTNVINNSTNYENITVKPANTID